VFHPIVESGSNWRRAHPDALLEDAMELHQRQRLIGHGGCHPRCRQEMDKFAGKTKEFCHDLNNLKV